MGRPVGAHQEVRDNVTHGGIVMGAGSPASTKESLMRTLIVTMTVWAVLASAAPALAQQSGADALPGVTLSLDELKAQMFHVRLSRAVVAVQPAHDAAGAGGRLSVRQLAHGE